MIRPYRIEGPALISFSGGRTSGLMLHSILEEYDGKLPDNVHVVFANTGKERPETLDFVNDCFRHFKVGIHWVEFRVEENKPTYTEVTYETASRKGEPFDALLRWKQYLPNPVMRMCTQEMKIRVMKKWMIAHGYTRWTNVVGLRADEPRRVAKQRGAKKKERWDVALPLTDAGVTKHDVRRFWQGQPFDLQLRSWEGNCDLCFLKGADKVSRIMLERPDLVQWWAEAEAEARASKPNGAVFRIDRPPYAKLLKIVQDSPAFPGTLDENHGAIVDCLCSDDMDFAEDESCGVIA